MLIIKYTLSGVGDTLSPSNLIKELQGDFLVIDKWEPNDLQVDKKQPYGFGSISIWHPKQFVIYSDYDNAREYEKWFVAFLEANHSVFIKNGAEGISIYLEVFHSGW